MNHPDRQQEASEPEDLPTRANAPGLSLKAYVEREAAAIVAARGPTMAEILEELDRHRPPDGPTTEDIVNALHESRRERDEQIEAWWQQ
jgi:hypothetical protein